MRNAKGSLRVGIAVVLFVSAFNLTACGGRIKPVTQVAPATQAPSNFYDNINQTPDPYPSANYGNQYGGTALLNSAPNTQSRIVAMSFCEPRSW